MPEDRFVNLEKRGSILSGNPGVAIQGGREVGGVAEVRVEMHGPVHVLLDKLRAAGLQFTGQPPVILKQ